MLRVLDSTGMFEAIDGPAHATYYAQRMRVRSTSRAWMVLLGSVCAGLLGGAIGCQEAAMQLHRSVVLITIDTLRADHLPTYGYFRNTAPNLERMAQRATVFERAVTPMATTLPAHTSMMTGTRPRRHNIVRNGLVFESEPDLRTVAEMLKTAGYQTVAVVSASPVAEETGISVGFDQYDDPKLGPRPASTTTDLALAHLRRLDDRPFFMWVHYWDPHDPYTPPPPYDRKFSKSDGIREFLQKTGTKLSHRIGHLVFDVVDINNRYDGEIAYMDAHLGRFLEGLREAQRFDETAIVVTSDHGEGLWQHGWHDHGRIYNEQIFVPLLIKPPKSFGYTPSRRARIATTIDIFPTLGRMLDLPFPERAYGQFEGIDLFDPVIVRPYVISERVHRHRAGWEPGRKRALTGRDYKLFDLSDQADQLYDLREDPYELHDLRARAPHVETKLKRYLRGRLAAYADGERKTRRNVGPDLVEKLRSLGYVQ